MPTRIEVDRETLELVKADFLNETYILDDPGYTLYRFDNQGLRNYLKVIDGHIVGHGPSVTSVIHAMAPMSPYLLKWYADLGYKEARRVLDESALYGTFVHIIFGNLLLGETLDLGDTLEGRIIDFIASQGERPESLPVGEWVRNCRQDVVGFIQWVHDYQVEPIAIEMPLFKGEDKPFGGTLDLVAKITHGDQRVTALIDFKTGRKDFYESHEIQLFALKDLWEYNWELPIDRLFNYGCKDFRIPIGKTVTPYRFKDQTDSRHAWKWQYYLDGFYADPANTTVCKTTRIKPVPVNINTDISGMFEEVDPLQPFPEEAF